MFRPMFTASDSSFVFPPPVHSISIKLDKRKVQDLGRNASYMGRYPGIGYPNSLKNSKIQKQVFLSKRGESIKNKVYREVQNQSTERSIKIRRV